MLAQAVVQRVQRGGAVDHPDRRALPELIQVAADGRKPKQGAALLPGDDLGGGGGHLTAPVVERVQVLAERDGAQGTRDDGVAGGGGGDGAALDLEEEGVVVKGGGGIPVKEGRLARLVEVARVE